MGGGHSGSTKPSNPFAQLSKPSNPFQTLPAEAKSPFRSPFASASKPQINANALKELLFNNFRSKRQAGGLIEVTEEDFAEFLDDFSEFKDDVATKMSNLTSNYQVNLKAYTEDFWGEIDLSQTLAGEDPVWRKMMIDGYND